MSLGHEIRLVAVALQYFTRLPVPDFREFDPAWLSESSRYFPLVGWVVGGLLAGALWLAAQLFPPAVAVLLCIAFSLVLTGAFHEDGLADSFDALGGSVSRERALEIMRDSRLGTYGSAALMLDLALRAALLLSLPLAVACLALIASHPAARAGAAALMASLPYLRDDISRAKPVAHSLSRGNLQIVILLGLLPAAALAWAFPGQRLALIGGLLAVLVVHVLCLLWFRRRLGGYTGDTLGCCEQLGELGFLLDDRGLLRDVCFVDGDRLLDGRFL